MEWIAALKGKTVGLDTTPLIYFIEENPTYLETVRPFFEALSHGEFSAITSVVTLLEVLVHPFRRGDTKLAQQYRDILLNAENLTTILLSQCRRRSRTTTGNSQHPHAGCHSDGRRNPRRGFVLSNERCSLTLFAKTKSVGVG